MQWFHTKSRNRITDAQKDMPANGISDNLSIYFESVKNVIFGNCRNLNINVKSYN